MARAQVNYLVSGTPTVGVGATPGSSTSQISAVGTAGGVNNYPAAEGPTNVVDGNAGTKYLNFARTNIGVIVTLPSSPVITALRVTTANDAPERDPLVITIEGATAADPTNAAAGAAWTLIYSNVSGLATNPGRSTPGPVVSFANSLAFNTYRVLVTAIRDANAANSMQVADIQLLGFATGPAIITQQPQSQAIFAGQTANFSVAINGTPPHLLQWYSNNVPILNATNTSYTTPVATQEMNGTAYTVSVTNSLGGAVSSVATLTVFSNPRVVAVRALASNQVSVVYSRAVDVNSGSYTFGSGFEAFRVYGTNHSEVRVTVDTPFALDTTQSLTIQDVLSETGGLPILTNPTNLTFYYGFGRFCTDFNSGLPPNVALFGSATLSGGFVHITDAVASQNGALVISNLNGGGLLDRFRIHYRMELGGSSSPADGYSLSIGSDVPFGTSGEEGAGTGLILAFDNFNNGNTESPTTNAAPSIAVKWGGANNFLTNFLTTLMRTETFVDVDVNMDPDGTLDLIYNGIVVFNNFPTPFRGIVNPRFSWAGRTGGSFENAWIDDICINDFTPGPISFVTQPAGITVLEGLPATFTASVNGTIPYGFQWFTNNVAVPGANGASFTIPVATESLNGLQVRVNASNELGVVSSSTATLTVDLSPRVLNVRSRGNNEVVVTWTRAVDVNSGTYSFSDGFEAFRGYGASQREVVVTLDTDLQPGIDYQITIANVVSSPGGLTQIPNPTNVFFLHGYGTTCTDFNSGLPDGALLSGTAILSNGVVHLTDDAQTGACGTLYISNNTAGLKSDLLVATWRSRVGGPLNGNADGFSFNWASDLPTACGTFNAEEGAGTGLSFTADTYDNGAGPDNGIEIKWKGSRIAFLHVERNGVGNSNYLTRDVFVDAYVSVTPGGVATFIYDGNILSATIPNWTGITNGAYLFASRTGGQADNVWIDDLCINGFSLGPISITQQPTNTTVTVGHPARLSVGINGLPPYGIQWYSNNVAIAGANTPVYNTAPLGLAASGAHYSVVVSNYSGSITSSVATVTVRPDAGSLQTTVTPASGTNGATLTITWNNPNAVLQSTPSLTPPIVWTDVAYNSPFSYSSTNQTNVFFRLVER